MWDGAKSIGIGLAAVMMSGGAARAETASASLEDFTATVDASAHEFSLDFADTEPEPTPQTQPIEEIASRDPFADGQWVWNIYGEVGFGSNVGEMYSAHFGAGINVKEGLNLGFSVGFIYADMERDGSKDAFGGQLDVTLRWHFLRRDTWSLFTDVTGGMIMFNREFPKFGSPFNFIWQIGAGATCKLNEDLWLQGGIRWTHISNGNFIEDHGNPGYDALAIWCGVMLPF